MNYQDIDNYINFKYLKNGNVKLFLSRSKETNIIKLLKHKGFSIKIKPKQQFFLHGKHCNYNNLLDYFYNQFLEKKEYINLPPKVTHNELMNFFLKTSPIKKNGILKHYLSEDV